jgi:hypothetical protein
VSFSYTGAASSPVGAVRFAIGDTVEATSRITDEDIAYLLEQTGGNVAQASRLAVEAIIATLSSLCDQTVGSVSKSYSQMRDGWMGTLAILKSRSSYMGGSPLVGGISRVQTRLQDRDKDLKKPLFPPDDSRLRRRTDDRLVGGLGAGAVDDGT